MYVKQNLLITWNSSWIWKYISDKLKNDYDIIWVNRTTWLDITKDEDIEKLVNSLKENNTKLDNVFFNAWIWYFDNFEKINLQKHIDILNTNLIANIKLFYKLLPFLKENCIIVFNWSIAWKNFFKFWASYQASKFWLRWFAWSLNKEYTNFRIHIINPKIVNTPFHNNSNIKIDNLKTNSLEEIYQIFENIILKKENRFEIDI